MYIYLPHAPLEAQPRWICPTFPNRCFDDLTDFYDNAPGSSFIFSSVADFWSDNAVLFNFASAVAFSPYYGAILRNQGVEAAAAAVFADEPRLRDRYAPGLLKSFLKPMLTDVMPNRVVRMPFDTYVRFSATETCSFAELAGRASKGRVAMKTQREPCFDAADYLDAGLFASVWTRPMNAAMRTAIEYFRPVTDGCYATANAPSVLLPVFYRNTSQTYVVFAFKDR